MGCISYSYRIALIARRCCRSFREQVFKLDPAVEQMSTHFEMEVRALAFLTPLSLPLARSSTRPPILTPRCSAPLHLALHAVTVANPYTRFIGSMGAIDG
jgi:hypothetical protein